LFVFELAVADVDQIPYYNYLIDFAFVVHVDLDYKTDSNYFEFELVVADDPSISVSSLKSCTFEFDAAIFE
jgi:hypothetical protein